VVNESRFAGKRRWFSLKRAVGHRIRMNCVQYLKPHTVILFGTVACDFENIVFIFAIYRFNFNDYVL